MTEEHRINIMSDEAVVMSQGEQTDTPVPAGVLERFVALLIDWGIVSLTYQFCFLNWVLRAYDFDLTQIYLLLAGQLVPFILYEAVLSCGGRSTVGKKLVGIRVVDQNTAEPISFGRALVRSVGYLISGGLLMCGFLFAFIEERHRALHDYLAGSVVIEARPKTWAEKTALSVVGFVLLFGFVTVEYKQVFGAGSFAQQRLINRAKDHVVKIGYLEELHRTQFGYYTNDLLRLAILSGDPVQFQRDTHKVLDNRDFRIGISEKGYKIKARAKDVKKTPVYFPGYN